jgi:hypothetical protein
MVAVVSVMFPVGMVAMVVPAMMIPVVLSAVSTVGPCRCCENQCRGDENALE